jgi:hypothetical protein
LVGQLGFRAAGEEEGEDFDGWRFVPAAQGLRSPPRPSLAGANFNKSIFFHAIKRSYLMLKAILSA